MSRSSTILRGIHSIWLVWFVICLFAARILYVVVMKQIAELKVPVQLLIIFFISMVGIIIGKKYAYLPWSLDVALVSLPFLMAGDYLAKYELFKNKFNITMLVAGFMWIIPLGMKMISNWQRGLILWDRYVFLRRLAGVYVSQDSFAF